MNQETLDPQDWEHHRKLGHQIIDDIVNYLRSQRDRKVWRPLPEKIVQKLNESYPQEPLDAFEVYAQAWQTAMEYPYGNIHPRFWAWINSPGTLMGVYGELLAATMNSNSIYGDHSAIHLEHQVLEWIKQMLGFSKDYSGILVSGGSLANLYGLTVARNSYEAYDVREEGLTNQPFTVYCSVETHNSVDKAVQHLGIGRKQLRKIPVDTDFQMDTTALEKSISKDRSNGFIPLAVVANAGTVNTGGIDPMDKIATICERENVWMHVDGAYGLFAMLSEEEKKKFGGIERADSVSGDLHKWMYVNYGAACVFIKSRRKHVGSFAIEADYLMKHERGLTISGGPKEFHELGLELTRKNRALKIWMSLKEHGVPKYGRMIEKDIQLAQYLESLVLANERLELACPTNLSIVCFRYTPKTMHEDLNHLNKEILMDLQEEGDVIISSTVLHGKYVFRTAITNHRSTSEDIKLLVNSIVRLGNTRTQQ